MASKSLSISKFTSGDLPGHVIELGLDEPLKLISGKQLSPFTVAFQTYGELNPQKSNAVLVCHALTGDQYVANPHPLTGKPGWWDLLVGPGRLWIRISFL